MVVEAGGPRRRLAVAPLRAADVTPGDDLPMVEESTAELVGRARSGDGDAYAMLFTRFHDEIYRFATRRLGCPQTGQDVAAQTFADAFAAIPRFRWRGAPFEAWLYTIARRRVADAARSRRLEAEPGDEPVDDHSSAVTTAVDMRAMIERLPPVERDVIELRFMEDLDVEQTARRLGKQPGAIRVAQHRALARLRGFVMEAH